MARTINKNICVIVINADSEIIYEGCGEKVTIATQKTIVTENDIDNYTEYRSCLINADGNCNNWGE